MGLVDFFFETDKKPESVQQPSPMFETKQQWVPQTSTSQPIQFVDTNKFAKYFDELFNASNLPGPDYYEFSKMVEIMNAPGMNEDMRLSAAFAGLSVQGLTKAKLLESAQAYINIIDTDAQQFANAVARKVNTDLETKKTRAKDLLATIQQKQDLILQLQNEIVSDKQQSEKLTSEVMEQEQKMNENSNAYKYACENRKQQIQSDIQKITTLIK